MKSPPARGAGLAVALGDFYALVPSPITLVAGSFEQTNSLRNALWYRDRTNQALIDLDMKKTVMDLSGQGTDGKAAAANTALALLNEGWGWQKRRKSK